MIQITPHMRILIATDPIDFRGGIDGLAGLCRRTLQVDPFSGALFVFGNRGRTAIKVLVYDGQGFWLCHKRLSSGRFGFWSHGHGPSQELSPCELQMLLMGGDPSKATTAPQWRPLQSMHGAAAPTGLTHQGLTAPDSSRAATYAQQL